MPVTPFHFGPGALLKALVGQRLSLAAFAIVQVLIDLESGWNMLAGRYPIHDHLHTLPGALLVAIVVVLMRPCFPPAARLVTRALARVDGYPGWLVPDTPPPGWIALMVGAGLGATTHVALDAVIHADARPFVIGNPLYVAGSFVLVHVVCLVAGILGVAGWIARARRAVPHPARGAAEPAESSS